MKTKTTISAVQVPAQEKQPPTASTALCERLRRLSEDMHRVSADLRYYAGAMNKAKNEEQTTGGSMSKHTPGPWFIDQRTYDGGVTTHYKITASEGHGWSGNRYMSVSGCIDERDARLIAAAPELLEALEAALKLIELVMPVAGDVTRKARAAIAKATIPKAGIGAA